MKVRKPLSWKELLKLDESRNPWAEAIAGLKQYKRSSLARGPRRAPLGAALGRQSEGRRCNTIPVEKAPSRKHRRESLDLPLQQRKWSGRLDIFSGDRGKVSPVSECTGQWSTRRHHRLCALTKPAYIVRAVTRSFGTSGDLMVIEGIPAISCTHCGESWFTAQTMHKIERIKRLRKSIAVKRAVPVAMFLALA